MQFIDLKKQYDVIKEDVLREINEVLDSGQYILGEKVKILENELANFVNAKYCVGVSDGSKALLIALMALDIKAGDEIVVPAFTFVATASMVALLGAIPVFVDIDPKTYNIDPSLIEAAITKKTKAIISVSLYGQCADMHTINEIAKAYNLFVIEDAAQSLGASINGQYSGAISTIGCTSFFPSKPLGCYGDGGACFTNDHDLAEKMRWIRVHGQDFRYHHVVLGVNGRLDTIQAAILLAKLKIFPNELNLRQSIGERYSSLLAGSNCVTPYVSPQNVHVYAQYTILVSNRELVVAKLQGLGIPTAVHYPIPLHQQKALEKYHRGNDLHISEQIARQVLSLPMHPYLDVVIQDRIVESVLQCLN